MKKLTSYLAIALVGLTAFAVQTSSAQPSGISITNLISDPTNHLWDLSLLTNELQNLDFSLPTGSSSSVEIIYADPFTQSGGGKLAGSGTNAEVTLVLDDGGPNTNTFTGKYTTTGSVNSAKGVAHLVFSSRVTGKTVFPSDSKPSTVSASAMYNVKFDSINDVVSGTQVYHAAASGKGSTSKHSSLDPGATVSGLVSEIGDGTWTLQLDFHDATGDKLSGDASVILNSGQVYPFSFTGAFNPKNNQSKLNLKGIDAGKGSILQVMLDGSNLLKVTGRVSGQTVNIKASAP